jgi:hypothetical protein
MEAYKIGVSMMMTGNFNTVLAGLSKQLLGIHGNVKELEKSFSNLGPTIKNALAGLIGVEALRGLKDFVEATKDLSHELTQLKKQGLGDSDYNAFGASLRR